MLILAGVTLSIVFGENGIFSQSKIAAQKYENARLKEEQELQNASNLMSNLGVASNRDEPIDYEAKIRELETTVNNLNLAITNLNKKNEELETKLNIVTTPNTMSATEHATGEFYYNGKPIYEKTIYIQSLPNNKIEKYDHGISYVEDIWFDMSKTYLKLGSGTTTAPVMTTNGSNRILLSGAGTTNFSIYSSYDTSAFSAYITLRYTKSDDTGNSTTIPATTANQST